jgi:hypothetical protein
MATPLSLLLILPIAALSSCSLLDGGPDVSEPLPPQPRCAGGTSAPLSPALVTRTFRRHGLTVHRIPRDDWCGPDRAAVLSNQADHPDNVNAAVEEREGWYTCVLYKKSQRKDYQRNLDHEANSPIGSSHGEWAVANVACSLYPSSDDRADAQLHAFDVAMTDLATHA